MLASLVLTIVMLQVLHMALLSKLEAKEARIKNSGSVVGRQLQGRMFKTVISEMEERVKLAYRLDKSGTYHLLDNFLSSEHVVVGRSKHDVSIVTQCSSNHLHHLIDLSRRWNGPISVAVFTYDDDFIPTVSKLVHFHFCDDHIFRQVSFHLVYPISRAPKHFSGLSEVSLDCSARYLSSQALSDSHTSSLHVESNNYAHSIALEYPNNLLRNLAVNYAQTPYILMVDIDMIPSENLRIQFQNFMSTRSQKLLSNDSISAADNVQAFVIPVFEMQSSILRPPAAKKDLLADWDKGLIRPFYWEVCQKCQWPTDYKRWRELESDGHLSIGYTVQRVDPWEPFYIAKTSLPLYDERFKQYGFNRISQVCEMHVAGFTFHVLDNAFLLHKGFKDADKFHSQKEKENDRNRNLYRTFKEELKTRYPGVTRRC